MATSDLLLPSAAQRAVRWGQLYGAASAWRLAEAAQRIQSPMLVVAANAREASRLEDELKFFAQRSLAVQLMPGWETLPYDVFSPHPDIVSQRLRQLAALPQGRPGITVIELATLLQRLAPRQYIDAHAFAIKRGQKLDLENFRARLTAAGYAHVSQVMAPGECAVRGSLLDLFPMGAPNPYRIDLFDDEIESIRLFDPETQRSGDRVEKISMLPAREFPLDADGVTAFKRRFRSRFEGDLSRMSVYRDIAPASAPPGIEYYLPLFFDGTAT